MDMKMLFPRHTLGQLADEVNYNPPPPIGLLTLASYARDRLPGLNIVVYDGNRMDHEETTSQLNGDYVGISVWFSNYASGLAIAKNVKEKNPETKVVFGGPHVNGIERRILENNDYVDFVISRDGEVPLVELLNGTEVKDIPGLTYRSSSGTVTTNDTSMSQNLQLDQIPDITLADLQTPYETIDNASASSMFPISGVRGCARTKRCEYCSIPTVGVRTLSPERYWNLVGKLSEETGSRRFFETGDIFPPKLAKKLSSLKRHDGINLKVYTYPGYVRESNVEAYVDAGIDNVFMGVESVLVWEQKGERRYGESFGISELLNEIDLMGRNGITVMPAFMLGLMGETPESLEKNERLIKEVAERDNVKELLLGVPLPLPGSYYFYMCMEDVDVGRRYRDLTDDDLLQTDRVDYEILSKIFVERFTDVSFDTIASKANEIIEPNRSKFACWSGL